MTPADRHRLSVYDATYLWLAIDVDGELATFDRDLARAAAAEGVPSPWVRRRLTIPAAAGYPSRPGISWTATPSMNVASTAVSPIAPPPGSNRSRSRIARSASFPTASVPVSSRWFA